MDEPVMYGFGPYRFDARDGVLTRAGEPVPLTPKAAHLLRVLLESEGQTLTKDELIRRVWPSTFVEDGSLPFQMHLVRQALGDAAADPKYIVTIPRRGYRFIVPVARLSDERPDPAGDPARAVVDLLERDASDDLSDRGLETAYQPHSTPSFDVRRRWYPWLGFVALAVLALSAAIVAHGFRDPPLPHVSRVTQLTHDGKIKYGLLLLDRSRLLFNVLLEQREFRLDGGTSARVEAREPYLFLDVSPVRGEALAIRARDPGADRGLWIVRLDGTQPRRLGMAETSGSAAWSHDARRIAYGDGPSVYVADADGTSTRLITTVTGVAGSVQWAPGDRYLRVHVSNASDRTRTQVLYDIDPDGSEPTPVLLPPSTLNPCCGFWTPGGRDYVFESSSDTTQQVWVRREPRHLLWKSEPELRQLSPATGSVRYSSPVSSADGGRIFVIGTTEPRLSRYDPNQGEFVPYLGGIAAFAVEFSPDRQWVSYITDGDSTLWRARADGSEPRRLTGAPWHVDASAWSPDGRRLAIRARLPGSHTKVFLLSAEGGVPQPLVPGDAEQGSPTWSPDGTRLTFGDVPERYGQATGSEKIHIYHLDTHTLSDVTASDSLWSSRWSPDGRHLTATRIVDRELMLFTFATNEWRDLGVSGVGDMRWSRDSQYIYCEPEPRARWVRRVRVSDGYVEPLIDVSEEALPRFGAGVALDGMLLFLRAATDIYAFELERR